MQYAEASIGEVLLKAYRWQYIASGVQERRFDDVIAGLANPAQRERIGAALRAIIEHVAHPVH